MSDSKPRALETELVRIQSPRSPNREHAVPIYLTSSFVFDDAEHARAVFAEEAPGQIYTRFSNPNCDEFVEKLRIAEGCEAGIATATGMAAMHLAITALLKAGDHVVAARAVFGSTHQILTKILPRFGIEHTYVQLSDVDAWAAAIRPNTRLLVLETPSNPGLELADLDALGTLARERGVELLVDNCFATPVLQRPATYGAGLVVHSATKWIDGQGRVLGGAILGRADLIAEARFLLRHTGPALSPFNAWVLSKSLETLSVRMARHCESALRLAGEVERLPGVTRVRHPFLDSHPQQALARRQMKNGGGLFTIELEGGLDAARRFVDALTLCSVTANLGDTRTIVTHPASTTHSKLAPEERAAAGISDGLLRVSVGLEDPADVLDDLAQAIRRATAL